jgi:hypothetical protein
VLQKLTWTIEEMAGLGLFLGRAAKGVLVVGRVVLRPDLFFLKIQPCPGFEGFLKDTTFRCCMDQLLT